MPILLVDARSGRIADCNDACSRLLGYDRSEVAGVPLEELTDTPSGVLTEHLLMARTCQDDGPRRRMLRARDGSELPLEVRAAPAEGDRGTLLALPKPFTRMELAQKTRKALTDGHEALRG